VLDGMNSEENINFQQYSPPSAGKFKVRGLGWANCTMARSFRHI